MTGNANRHRHPSPPDEAHDDSRHLCLIATVTGSRATGGLPAIARAWSESRAHSDAEDCFAALMAGNSVITQNRCDADRSVHARAHVPLRPGPVCRKIRTERDLVPPCRRTRLRQRSVLPRVHVLPRPGRSPRLRPKLRHGTAAPPNRATRTLSFVPRVHVRPAEGVPQDYAEGATWYRRAAEQGDGRAQFSLGNHVFRWRWRSSRLCRSCDVVPPCRRTGRRARSVLLREACISLAKAFLKTMPSCDWFRRAAEQGHTDAQFLLGLMYDDGRGVLQDDEEATQVVRRAAEQGRCRRSVHVVGTCTTWAGAFPRIMFRHTSGSPCSRSRRLPAVRIAFKCSNKANRSRLGLWAHPNWPMPSVCTRLET